MLCVPIVPSSLFNTQRAEQEGPQALQRSIAAELLHAVPNDFFCTQGHPIIS